MQLQLQLPLHWIRLRYTTLQQQRQLQPQLQLHYFKLHHTGLHYTIPHYSTQQQYKTVCYTNYTTPQPQMQVQLHCKNYTTLQLQLHYTASTTSTALHHTTSSSCIEMTAATIATPKNTTATTLRSRSGFALQSVIHNNQRLL